MDPELFMFFKVSRLLMKNLKLFYLQKMIIITFNCVTAEPSTLKPKMESSNPVTGTGEVKMVKQKQEKMEI
jgi:hypothetical protein